MVYKIYVITRDNEYQKYATILPKEEDEFLKEPEEVTMLKQLLFESFDCVGVVVKQINSKDDWEEICSVDLNFNLKPQPKGDFVYRFYILNEIHEYEKVLEIPTFIWEEEIGEPSRVTELKNIIRESNAFLEMIIIRHDNRASADEVYDVEWLKPLARKHTKEFLIVEE